MHALALTLLLLLSANERPSVAGDYYRGDGLGVNQLLSLDANHHFLLHLARLPRRLRNGQRYVDAR